jgi:hypothetical protein
MIKEQVNDMTRIRLIMLAMLAVCCMSAVASATASAASKGEFVNKEGKALVKNDFTATSGATRLETNAGVVVTCTADLALGVLLSTTTGEQTVHFTGCVSSTLPCKSTKPAASKSGEILVLSALAVSALTETEDTISNTIVEPGTKTAGTLEFECSGLKVKVKGGFYSNGVAVNGGLKKSWALKATNESGKKGKQSILKNKAGVEKTLETSVEGGEFKASSEEGTETSLFLEEGQFV